MCSEVLPPVARSHTGEDLAETSSNRFYGDLAAWWPLISPPEEYAGEAAFVRRLLEGAGRPVRDVLELGSGGGHNASHLADRFALTLVDVSEGMLDVSRRLNPDCTHVQGDMRTVRLDRTFDAVFVHDAIEYMTTLEDLRAALETAFIHCRPGAIAVFMPDCTVETFEPGSDSGGADGDDGRAVRFLEWTWDPAPDDDWVATEYAFVLRESDGSVEVVHETHRTGLFRRATWTRLLAEVGFVTELVVEDTDGDHRPRDVFVGRRPDPDR